MANENNASEITPYNPSEENVVVNDGMAKPIGHLLYICDLRFLICYLKIIAEIFANVRNFSYLCGQNS